MNTVLRSALLVAALATFGPQVAAQSKSKKGKAPVSAPAPSDKKVTIASKLKTTVAYDGLMKVYQDTVDGKLYLKLSTVMIQCVLLLQHQNLRQNKFKNHLKN